jgi:phage/plasmid-like protein (TIGR03299 family)
MAHEITSTDAMFSVREMPWHGLGEVLPVAPTREEAQRIAHPWEVMTAPLYTSSIGRDGTEQFTILDSHKRIVRDDNMHTLGVVGDTYTPTSNSELHDIAEAIILGSRVDTGRDPHILGAEPEAQYETAGSLRGGKQVWILLRMSSMIAVAGDPHGLTLPFFALQNSHDGSGAFTGGAGETRIVCANTVRAFNAEQHGMRFSFKHTPNVAARIAEARAAVSSWRAHTRHWSNLMENLIQVKATADQREKFVELFQPMPAGKVTERVQGNVEAARKQLRDILASVTCEGTENSAYGLFQAGIEWSQHFRTTRARNAEENGLTEERSRMESHFRRSVLTGDDLQRDVMLTALQAVDAPKSLREAVFA